MLSLYITVVSKGLHRLMHNKSELITIWRVVITSEVKGVESSINEMRTNERQRYEFK